LPTFSFLEPENIFGEKPIVYVGIILC
jgi:hypothetical protein